MDFKKIKKLVSLVETSDISSLSLEEDNLKIEIKRESAPVVSVQQPTMTVSAPAPTLSEPISSTPSSAPQEDPSLVEIKSPMVGTFYAAASPDAPTFVSPGQSVSNGDVVCIVEAMKLFNEIESEVSGTIEKVCLNNGDPVEFGQALFLVRPS